MHVRGVFFQGYQTIRAHMSYCVNQQRSVPSETVFSPETVGGESRAGIGKLREKQPHNPAPEPGSLALCLSAPTSPTGRASPDQELLCWLNQGCAPSPLGWGTKYEQRWLILYKTRVLQGNVTERVDFASLSFPQKHFPPEATPAKPSGKYCSGSANSAWNSVTPFLGNYYKWSLSPCRAGLVWFSILWYYHEGGVSCHWTSGPFWRVAHELHMSPCSQKTLLLHPISAGALIAAGDT